MSYITLEEPTYDIMGLLWRGQSRAGQQSTLREVPVGRKSNCWRKEELDAAGTCHGRALGQCVCASLCTTGKRTRELSRFI